MAAAGFRAGVYRRAGMLCDSKEPPEKAAAAKIG